jgi:Tol biopolymer transport system component
VGRQGRFICLLVVLVVACGSSPHRPGAAGVGAVGTLLIVAEHRHESGGLDYPSDIYVVDVDGTHLRDLTHDRAANYSAQWAPDGKRIVFDSRPSDRAPKRELPHVFVIDRDGTHRRRLTSDAGGELPAVSPDGNWIAFAAVGREQGSIYLMDAEGGRMRRLVDGRGYLMRAPSWSSDGRMLAFIREDCVRSSCTRPHLFLVNRDGTGLTRVHPQVVGLVETAVWSPTQPTLALGYSDTTSGANGLVVADVVRHGSRFALQPVRKLANLWPWSAAWSPDGLTISYSNDRGAWLAAARGRELARRFPLRTSFLAWSPTGRWVALAGSRVLATDPVGLATAEGKRLRAVTREICCLLDSVEWAPR